MPFRRADTRRMAAEPAVLAMRYVSERRRRHEFTDSTARTARNTLLIFCRYAPDRVSLLSRKHVEAWLDSRASTH